MKTSFEVQSRDSVGTMTVTTEAGAQEFKLVLDFDAMDKILDKLGVDLCSPMVWINLKGSKVPLVLHAAMQRHHPEMTIEKVHALIPINEVWGVRNLLMEMCFPGIMEKAAEEVQAKAANPPAAAS